MCSTYSCSRNLVQQWFETIVCSCGSSFFLGATHKKLSNSQTKEVEKPERGHNTRSSL